MSVGDLETEMGELLIALILIGVALFIGFRRKKNEEKTPYEKSGNWADFDPGKDADKVGDPKFPNAGPDSVMKEEFLENLLDEKK